jgi:dTMP kinase
MKSGRALFIAFEGIDGSGKSTLCELVHGHYVSLGFSPVRLREPTEGQWGRRIRELLKGPAMPDVAVQLELFLNDREEDVRMNLAPALGQGKMVLMDRYYYSNAAYQGALGIPPESIIEQNRKRGFPEPDRVYLLDIAPEEALRRIRHRNGGGKGGDAFERMYFLEKVREIYLSIADDKFRVMDGTLPQRETLAFVLRDLDEGAFVK